MSLPPISFSRRALQTSDQPISYFMQQAVENPGLISLAAGLVDSCSLPWPETAEAIAALWESSYKARAALQYGTTQGYLLLREKLLARTAGLDGMNPGDMSLTAENVVICTGSQQLLYLVSELLLNPGDVVIVESPSYFVYQGTLDSLAVRTLSVPMDDDGMRIDALEELLCRLEMTGDLERVRLIYVCDYYQNPSGLTLSLPRRRQLLEVARSYSKHHRILILEDAAYRELRYEGQDLPSVKSFDVENEQVILAMTFSKSFAPGLKTGYGFLPTDLIEPLIRFKGSHDFGSNNFTQYLLSGLLESGAYDRHVGELRDLYRKKRDVLLKTLADELGSRPEVHWRHPEGGLFVWLKLPDWIDTGPESRLMKNALREGVLYVPGQFCHVNGSDNSVPKCEARLSFGEVSAEQIGEAVRRLARVVVSELKWNEGNHKPEETIRVMH